MRTRDAAPRRRVDRGRARVSAAVVAEMARLLGGQQRPRFSHAHRELVAFCQRRALPEPSRATLYNAVGYVPVPVLRWSSLPLAVRRSLYNLEPSSVDATIAGDSVAFYAFNYGEPRAMSFASGLPWLCLARAERRPGWRLKSRALLRAVMRSRKIA